MVCHGPRPVEQRVVGPMVWDKTDGFSLVRAHEGQGEREREREREEEEEEEEEEGGVGVRGRRRSRREGGGLRVPFRRSIGRWL